MTGKGQCHSMPLLYLAIAEQLGAKAYLSLAPEHSFIQYFNNDNDRINFETTNGNMVSQSFMLRSGFINASALKNKTYLDTLSQRQLYAQCLADLLISYEREHGHDDFAEQMKQKIQQINPTWRRNEAWAKSDGFLCPAVTIIRLSPSPSPERMCVIAIELSFTLKFFFKNTNNWYF
jgi:hypothetical protein